MILKMSLLATVLILVIVLIRAVAINKLPKKTFLVLWGIALFRLLIPFSIPSQFSIYTVFNALKRIFSQGIAPMTTDKAIAIPNVRTVYNITNNDISIEPSARISPFMVIWIIGLIVCATFIFVTHLRSRREYKTALPIDNDFVNDWLYKNQIWRNILIRQSDKISGPLTYGVLNPVILLPKSTDLADENLLQYVLTHEYVHIRRFDILSKCLLVAALCIHWFNPIMWVMYILANRDLELACDETVVRMLGETKKCSYAMALIVLEEKKFKLNLLCNNFNKNAIEERIVSIMKMKKLSLMGTTLAITLVILTATAFATSAVEPKLDNNVANISADIEQISSVTDNSNSSTKTSIGLEDLVINETAISLDNYKAWLEKQKAYLQELVNSGEWSQKSVDEQMKSYEKYLSDIEQGAQVSVFNDGKGHEDISCITALGLKDFDITSTGNSTVISDKIK